MANDPFLRWFVPWLAVRRNTSPIGWYTVEELEAAFHAGHHATDDRPGHTSPPQAAGPVPPSRRQDRP